MQIQNIFKADDHIGEAPLWFQEKQVLYWVDIHGKLIHVLDPKTPSQSSYTTPDLVTALALQKKGLLLALRKQIASLVVFPKSSLPWEQRENSRGSSIGKLAVLMQYCALSD